MFTRHKHIWQIHIIDALGTGSCVQPDGTAMSDILHGRITEVVLESVKLWEATQHLHHRVAAASARAERLREAHLVADFVNGRSPFRLPCPLCACVTRMRNCPSTDCCIACLYAAILPCRIDMDIAGISLTKSLFESKMIVVCCGRCPLPTQTLIPVRDPCTNTCVRTIQARVH